MRSLSPLSEEVTLVSSTGGTSVIGTSENSTSSHDPHGWAERISVVLAINESIVTNEHP